MTFLMNSNLKNSNDKTKFNKEESLHEKFPYHKIKYFSS